MIGLPLQNPYLLKRLDRLRQRTAEDILKKTLVKLEAVSLLLIESAIRRFEAQYRHERSRCSRTSSGSTLEKRISTKRNIPSNGSSEKSLAIYLHECISRLKIHLQGHRFPILANTANTLPRTRKAGVLKYCLPPHLEGQARFA